MTRNPGQSHSAITLQYKARGFDPKYGLSGDRSITTTWNELVHAAITVGRQGWGDVWKHGRHSFFEIIYRAMMLLANLRPFQGQIRKSDAYRGLDRSEKAAVSYFLGLTFANLMARRLFRVQWMMHLDVYHNTLQPHLLDSGRPDLVGRDAKNRWYVMEAKGRSNGLAGDVVVKAKEQTMKLLSVRGKVPRLRVASIAFFSRGSLSMHLEDPVGQDIDGIDWNFTEDQFLRDYYDPFAVLVDQGDRIDESELNPTVSSETVNGIKFFVAHLRDIDLEIGLAQSVYEIHRSGDYVREGLGKAITRALARINERLISVDVLATRELSDSVFIGTDGILVRVGPSWFGSDE